MVVAVAHLLGHLNHMIKFECFFEFYKYIRFIKENMGKETFWPSWAYFNLFLKISDWKFRVPSSKSLNLTSLLLLIRSYWDFGKRIKNFNLIQQKKNILVIEVAKSLTYIFFAIGSAILPPRCALNNKFGDIIFTIKWLFING